MHKTECYFLHLKPDCAMKCHPSVDVCGEYEICEVHGTAGECVDDEEAAVNIKPIQVSAHIEWLLSSTSGCVTSVCARVCVCTLL